MVKSGSQYDIVVNGSNLTGILLAHYFSRANYKVLLLEESDDVGRSHFHDASDSLDFRSGLEFLPDLEAS
ncbi:MAG: NAD(P)-binding protein, partial [Pseudomonadota bacterium]